MMQLREVRLVGTGVKDAVVTFAAGANVITGDSDTGKSYMLRCIDFVLGADEMTKTIDEAKLYERVLVEFKNNDGDFLTLERHLSGGDVAVYHTPIDERDGAAETVNWKRKGRSTAPDVTSIIFSFCGMKEAALRTNKDGAVQRLSIRTMLPVFLIDEISIQAEQSPIFGEKGYDETPRKRMFSFILTGKDDTGIISQERREITQAELKAKLGLIDSLLEPIEKRLLEQEKELSEEDVSTIDRVDTTIERLSAALTENNGERVKLRTERLEAIGRQQHAEGQIVAIDELIKRYRLLEQRYTSDLDRLDFVSEGAHFFKGLQKSHCPLCDQPLGPEHAEHFKEEAVRSVYEAAQAEAAKIHGHRTDLALAMENLQSGRQQWIAGRDDAASKLTRIDRRVSRELTPRLQETKARLDELIQRRLELEGIKSDADQATALRDKRIEFEKALGETTGSAPKKWASIEPSSLHQLCMEVESVLKSWGWPDTVRVEFDEGKAFDIKVDGKARQSHGKGYRAILHAAFSIAILQYCVKNGTPHPGFLVIDSPLTPFKKTEKRTQSDTIDPGIEERFWNSLLSIDPRHQIVVLENKEPSGAVASSVNYI
ncbi:MAG: hypothetical protein IPK66_17665, partial [Rhodospirillales bacterium]|nr:hypothetical protein [Rhodospirillales bacterium]